MSLYPNDIWDSPNMPQEISNSLIYMYYRTRLINAFMSRFDYKDSLPDTCDSWYMENVLLEQGTATLMQENVTGKWFSLGYTYYGNLNLYKMPTKILGVGYGDAGIDGEDKLRPDYTHIEPRGKNFAIGFDNPSRSSPMNIINYFSYRLWETEMSARSNIALQNKPYIITAPKNLMLSIKNLMLKIFGKERVIQLDNTQNINEIIQVLDLKVPYIGNDIYNTIETIWNQALAMLGCMSETDKKERLLAKEASMNQWENQLNLISALREREKMLNKAIKLGIPGNPNVEINKLPSEALDLKLPGEDGDING